MELKEGMYARTLDGIMKIVELRNDSVMGRFRNEDGNIYFYNDMMCNPSFNIIDLIECLDIVELYIIGLEEDNITTIKRPETLRELKDLKKYIKSGAKIKSITTKEQFESMSYKVGE